MREFVSAVRRHFRASVTQPEAVLSSSAAPACDRGERACAVARRVGGRYDLAPCTERSSSSRSTRARSRKPARRSRAVRPRPRYLPPAHGTAPLPAVYFLHGFTGSARGWTNFSIFTPTVPGAARRARRERAPCRRSWASSRTARPRSAGRSGRTRPRSGATRTTSRRTSSPPSRSASARSGGARRARSSARARAATARSPWRAIGRRLRPRRLPRGRRLLRVLLPRRLPEGGRGAPRRAGRGGLARRGEAARPRDEALRGDHPR